MPLNAGHHVTQTQDFGVRKRLIRAGCCRLWSWQQLLFNQSSKLILTSNHIYLGLINY
jgi:hypothetical protein